MLYYSFHLFPGTTNGVNLQTKLLCQFDTNSDIRRGSDASRLVILYRGSPVLWHRYVFVNKWAMVITYNININFWFSYIILYVVENVQRDSQYWKCKKW